MDVFSSTVLKLLGVLVLVLLNGFFVAAEFALVRVRDTQLEPLVAKGERRGRLARWLIHHLDATIGATQLGITLASLGLGILVEPVFESLLSPVFGWLNVPAGRLRHTLAILVGFVVNTFLLVVGASSPYARRCRQRLRSPSR